MQLFLLGSQIPCLQDIENQYGHKHLAQQDIANKTTLEFSAPWWAFLKNYEKIAGLHMPLNQEDISLKEEKMPDRGLNNPFIRMYVLLPRTIRYSFAPFLIGSNKSHEIDRFTLTP